ncbi:Rap1a/Tai family immunity protein [Nitrosovibrio sp. Nv4]|uniref:Rap1a/Tai family immunity protein n=1 Tax=Nitrosovibrio sp. Nv4 TaxID=1945880 RepID=UPI000BD1EEF1|nr:Rap1a/Tai family immunity protein [Nitrosovibrio sp. Nv4]SOD39883.1 hypothetical protein SAMN06298226_0114 [Nitrosovibrio sp. Nv4]
MKIFAVIIAVWFFIPTSETSAYDFAHESKSGSGWMNMCGKYGTDEFLDTMCELYTGGIIEGGIIGYLRERRDMAADKPLDNNPNAMFYCKTKDQTTKQHILVIKKYIEDHPKFLHMPAVILIIQALSEAFPYPCQNRGNEESGQ